jgi:Tfp pilus assembly protein PilV
LDIPNVNAQTPKYRPLAARRRSRGFTLVEAALTMVIIGTGVVAMLQLLAAGTMSNSSAAELTTAVQLANNIHEVALALPFKCPTNLTSTTFKDAGDPTNYTYLWDLNGDSYNPPRDIRRIKIDTYPTWTQQVTVQSVDPTNLDAVRPNSVTLPTARLTVVILHNNKRLYKATFLICAPNS